jgi:hypothetical protein
MRLKSLFIVAACAFCVVAFTAGSAFAGEIRGPGSPTGVVAGSPNDVPTAAPTHANSICAFSGLNHLHLDANGNPEEGELLTRTQSYGQLVAAGLKAFLPSPGEACNGSLNPLQGSGG